MESSDSSYWALNYTRRKSFSFFMKNNVGGLRRDLFGWAVITINVTSWGPPVTSVTSDDKSDPPVLSTSSSSHAGAVSAVE